jgi:hypothetical protein
MDVAASVETAPTPASTSAADPASRAAARSLLAVTVLGVAVAALTWRVTDAGVGWLATDAVLVVALLAGTARGRPGGAAWLFAVASLWLAGATCWYASDWALATALPGSVLALGALALVTARRTRPEHVADLGRASLDALRSLPAGIADAARMPVEALGGGARGHALGVLRGVLLGAPIALFFTALLAADGTFRHALEHILGRSGDGFDLALWTGATTCGLLVATAVLRRVQIRSTMGAAPASAVVPFPYRTEGDAPALARAARARPTGPRIRPLTWGVVLAQIVAVFGVYVGANAGSLFAGHAHLRAAGTVTYAGYLHEGFTQVSVATLLAVACVVAGHLLLRPRDGSQRVAGGRGLVALELALLALVGVTLASCAHRLSLYEDAYGYTYLRLGVWLMQLGAGGMLAMTAARCVARGWRGWGSALAWSGVTFAMLAGSLDADGWLAQRNVERAGAGAPLDTGYLATLSEDARGVLPAVAAIDRGAAGDLEHAWWEQASQHRRHGWRAMRGLGAR